MIQDNVNKAKSSRSFMVATWRIEDGRVYLTRDCVNFPTQEFYTALSLLREDLERESKTPLLLGPVVLDNMPTPAPNAPAPVNARINP